MNAEKLPHTDSIQEMARFWDAHDLTDFENQLEEVTQPVFERETVVEIHLPAQQVEAVKQIANSKGVGFTDLIRDWILGKVHLS